MKATYYAIIEDSTKDIVDEGIIKHSEDTIYPGQNTGIDELPSECEAHHFKAVGYSLEMCNFVLTRGDVISKRTTGDKISMRL